MRGVAAGRGDTPAGRRRLVGCRCKRYTTDTRMLPDGGRIPGSDKIPGSQRRCVDVSRRPLRKGVDGAGQIASVHVAACGEPGPEAPVVTTMRFESTRATGALRNPGIQVRCDHVFIFGSYSMMSAL